MHALAKTIPEISGYELAVQKVTVLLSEMISGDRQNTTNRGSGCRKWIIPQFGQK